MNSEDDKQIVSFYPEDDERLSIQLKEGSVETSSRSSFQARIYTRRGTYSSCFVLKFFHRFEDLMASHQKETKIRKTYLNELLDLKGNIRVLCRVRPLIHEDGDSNQIVSFDPSDDGRLSLFLKGSLNTYEVDKVFRPESTQEQV